MAERCFAVEENLLRGDEVLLPTGQGRVRLHAGARVVAFTRVEDDIAFTGTSIVEAVTAVAVDEGVFQRVRFRRADIWAERALLRSVAGSLEKIYRPLKPVIHFRRSIHLLPVNDYRAIVDRKIDVARSIFRFLFSALPLQLQAEFIRTYPGEFPMAAQGRIRSYGDLAPELVRFFRSTVRPVWSLLRNLGDAHGRIASDPPVEMSDLYVSGEDGADELPLGLFVRELASRRAANSLLGASEGVEELLDECERELESAEGGHAWNDPIFW
jgi:hypothetical protein